MKLYVSHGSTWSLRVWICAQLAEIKLDIHSLSLTGNDYKSLLIKTTTTGLVPALKTGEILIADSLAIAEYLNEQTNGALYPLALTERSIARSLVCELHSGFINIRTHCPFSSEIVQSSKGLPALESELLRLQEIFSKAKSEFMFDKPSIVDAFYSILAYRLNCYDIQLGGKAGIYQEALINWPILKQAIQENKNWRI